MKSINTLSIAVVLLLLACEAMARPDSTAVRLSGEVHAGVFTEINKDLDRMELTYSTPDPRLGTNSGCHYYSDIDDVSRNAHASYGANLHLDFTPQHRLSFLLEGVHDYERAFGTRQEHFTAADGQLLSLVKGTYHRPHELAHDLQAGVDYTYRLCRPGEALSAGYLFRWEQESAGLEQEIEETTGWSLYQRNQLEQLFTTRRHHAHLDYTLPVAKGHLLDFGLAYDRRDLRVQTEQLWDDKPTLEADYRHLTQYGGLHARYRLKMGPVEAMARLEYRATRMQDRWLHDVLPTATIRYRIDSVHALSAFYTIVLVRPEAQHLDTTHISDAYTQRFGNNNIVGIHIHNVALTYHLSLPHTQWAAELRYLTANDGFNAIWMERAGRRIYTWGNEGVRHAVSLKPSVDAHLSTTTDLHADITAIWDKRVAAAINLENANWGVRTNVRLTQQLSRPYSAVYDGRGTASTAPVSTPFLVLRGDYAYHNTLDVYSYAGHGGSVGADLKMQFSLRNSNVRLIPRPRTQLALSLGYTCLFKPDICITQGAYVGTLVYQPGATHLAALNLSYIF